MTASADRRLRWTTIACVGILALIAGTVSYLHMHALVALHGQPGWVAALTPFSVDGMIVAASTTLLADSRTGRHGGVLPWALLVAGSVASLAANVAVAEPTLIGRVIAAWPSFALTASYELLTRQVRRGSAKVSIPGRLQRAQTESAAPTKPTHGSELRLVRSREPQTRSREPHISADSHWHFDGVRGARTPKSQYLPAGSNTPNNHYILAGEFALGSLA